MEWNCDRWGGSCLFGLCRLRRDNWLEFGSEGGRNGGHGVWAGHLEVEGGEARNDSRGGYGWPDGVPHGVVTVRPDYAGVFVVGVFVRRGAVAFVYGRYSSASDLPGAKFDGSHYHVRARRRVSGVGWGGDRSG